MRTVVVWWKAPAPIMAALVAAGLVAQAYLAGLGVFGTQGWELHSIFGGILSLPIIGLALYARRGSSGIRFRRSASLLMALYLLQVALVVAGMETGLAWLPALHPANAMLMLIVTLDVLRRALVAE
jgi:hypothetical protein